MDACVTWESITYFVFFLLSGILCFLLFHIIVIVDSILPLGCRVILWVSKIFSNVTHTHTGFHSGKPKSLLISFFCSPSLSLSAPQSVCRMCRVLEYRFTNPETTMRVAKLDMKRKTTITATKPSNELKLFLLESKRLKPYNKLTDWIHIEKRANNFCSCFCFASPHCYECAYVPVVVVVVVVDWVWEIPLSIEYRPRSRIRNNIFFFTQL